jgi:hypothetical protein
MRTNPSRLLLVVLFLSPAWLFCQRQDSLASRGATNIVYGEVATMVFWTWGSVNYERMLNERSSVRIGVGGGYFSVPAERAISGYGATVMYNYFPIGVEHRLELGIGVAIANTTGPSVDLPPVYASFSDIPPELTRLWWYGPAVSIGYRYQPRDGGFLFRVGATLVNLFGFPLQVSLGYVW